MKRVLAVIMTILLLGNTFAAGAYSTEKNTNGDVDMNGVVNVSDVTCIQRYLVNLQSFTEDQMLLADTDLNGKVNIMDATKIQRALIGDGDLNDKPDDNTDDNTIGKDINIYLRDDKNWNKVYFYLYNSKTGTPESEWPGTLITETETGSTGKKVYKSIVDVEKYDRIIFSNGSRQTINVPVNKASSGFYIYKENGSSCSVKTYAYNGSDQGTLTTTTLNYSAGYDKKIWIWTPADYSPDSAEKYKTVYMADGQNLFADHSDGWGGWDTPQAVESMMSNGGRGVILVGIDNGNAKRDSELTPDIGEAVSGYGDFTVRTGEEYSDFVVNKVMPYVQANFNSSPKAEDNIVAGSSSGGLEAFYIGLEHRDKFSGIGALSPAFLLFTSQTWKPYLDKFDFTDKDMPMLYIFNGKGDSLEVELYDDAELMYNELLNRGYDKEKITFVVEDGFAHNEGYWRVIFPEMLSWIMGI